MNTVSLFRREVWVHYKKRGRHGLPWRKTRDPYKILVSEVMLQQTQVERVIPFYKRFLKCFPTAGALAEAPLGEVLRAWQGLGYNRRAKMLHEAAKEVTARWKGAFPKDTKELEKFPGIGPYTARAVAAFAYNRDAVFLETNIRTAVTHHFFNSKRFTIYGKKVADAEIAKVLERVMPRGRAREWYYALMDYGAHLKRSGIRINGRSAHYVKQKKFKGSNREARGAILRELGNWSTPGVDQRRLIGLLGREREVQVRAQLLKLLSEGLIAKRGRVFTLPR